MKDSRIPGLYRLGIEERIDRLQENGWLSTGEAEALKLGRQILSVRAGDKMIENVIATFGLPLAIAPNFTVNGKDYVVPVVVEEPSIVAALSSSASLARASGGFETSSEPALLTGQVHLWDIDDVAAAAKAILDQRDAIIASANEVHPRLTKRGGGVRDIEAHELELESGEMLLAIHLLVDTCDAMGANLVNTICEAIAPRLAELAGGKVAMRILSNLADHALVTARARYRLDDLGRDEAEAVRNRDAIVRANDIARADPHRAATHNKGVMNGIDAVAVATGNDWRAIEAGAHAWAARDGRYTSLTQWVVGENGDLEGSITLPLKVGTVGGTLDANPAAAAGLHISGVASAAELAELMAAVGLAQNFSAIRALATSGIQKGHMRLHARSLAAAAGAADELIDEVVEKLVESGDIKDWKAREIVSGMQAARDGDESVSAAGKIILLGEHAAVYGRHALAIPVPNGVYATASPSDGRSIRIPQWQLEEQIGDGGEGGVAGAIHVIVEELGIPDQGFSLELNTHLPRAMGLGSSAAVAVAIIRALGKAFEIELDNTRINEIAFECEQLAHGTPSGVDNTIATFGTPMLFRRDDELEAEALKLKETPPVVVGFSHTTGHTIEQVAGVRARRGRQPERYDAIFDEIDAVSLAGAKALSAGDYAELGELMNICQGLLNALEVSTPELEHMIDVARGAGALGAKLTGAGGGGSIVALCPSVAAAVEDALESAGFRTMAITGSHTGTE